MAHFANVDDNNFVREVIVVSNAVLDDMPFPESESVGQQFIADCGTPGTWLQCSYSASFRGWFPGPTFRYDPTLDAFIPPSQPEA